MRFDILTLFPEMLETVLSESIIGRARKKGIIEINAIQLRDFTEDKHRRIDDYPYGGGCGMVFKAPPVIKAIRETKKKFEKEPLVVYMSPKGKVLNQQTVNELSQNENFIILCGHYEGIDERIMKYVDMEISIGDYVLTGGEMPAAIMIDAVSRTVSGVLAEEDGFTGESHYDGLLEYPQYTRPEEFEGERVPDVLLSGHHENIAKWRREMQLEETLNKRPDLLEKAVLDKKDKKMLEKIEQNKS